MYSLYDLEEDIIENATSNSLSVVAYVSDAAETVVTAITTKRKISSGSIYPTLWFHVSIANAMRRRS